MTLDVMGEADEQLGSVDAHYLGGWRAECDRRGPAAGETSEGAEAPCPRSLPLGTLSPRGPFGCPPPPRAGSLYTVAALDGQTRGHLEEVIRGVANDTANFCVMCVG